MISSSQRPLPDNTQHSQQTDIHAPSGIRTHDLSRRGAVDLRLRPRDHWDRHSSNNYQTEISTLNFHTRSPLKFHTNKSNYGWNLERWETMCSLCDHVANFLPSHLLRSNVRKCSTYKTETHSWPRNEVSFIHHLSSRHNPLWSFSVFSFHRFIDLPHSSSSIRFLTERLFLRIYIDFRRLLNRSKCLGGCKPWNFYFKHQTLQSNFSFIQRLVSEKNVVGCENKSIDLNTINENTIGWC